MDITLVITSVDGRERHFPIHKRTVIGREPRCDLRVPLPSISLKHCEVVPSNGLVELKDLGSEQGTFCNGDRIEQAVLGDADRFSIGPVTFEVRMQPFDSQV